MQLPKYKHLLLYYKNYVYCIGGMTHDEKCLRTCEKYSIEFDR